MANKTNTLVVLAVAALSAPLFSTPVHGAVPEVTAVASVASSAWTVYVLVGGVPVDRTASASHGEGHVYIDGVLLGTVTPTGSIVNQNGIVVGFVVIEP